MEADNVVKEKLGEFGSIHDLTTWYNAGHLGKSVDKD